MRLATLAPAAAITSPVVASKRVEHRRELRRVELVRQARVAGDVGEPDRELDDVRARGRRAHVAVAPADQLELVAVEHVDHVGDAREQLFAPRRVAARDLDVLPVRGERRLDVRAQQRDLGLGDRARSPRPSCARAAASCSRPTSSVSVANELEHRDVARRRSGARTGAARRTRPRARPRPRARRRSRPRAAISASVQPLARRGAGCGTRRSSAARPLRAACTSSGIDAPISSVRYVEQREPRGARRARPGRTGPAAIRSSRSTVRRRVVVGAHENCPGASTGVARRPFAACPSASSGAAARRAASRPRRSVDDHAGSSAGARSSTPAGASHNSAGRAPCQRTANESGPARSGSVVDRERLAEPLGREAGKQLDARRSTRARARRAAPTGTRPGRARRRRRAPPPTDRRSVALRRARAASRQPSCAHAVGGFVVEAPVFERRRTLGGRAARAAGRRGPRRRRSPTGSGSSACSPRSSCRSQPRATASASGSARTSTGSPSARATSPSAARSVVRCGTGNSSASSIGAVAPVDRPRSRVAGHHDLARRRRPPPTRRGGRDSASTGSPSIRSVGAVERRPRRAPSTRTHERDRERRRRAVLDVDDDAPRAAPTVARVRACARPRRPARAPPSRTTGAGARPLLMRRRLVGRNVPAVVGADPPVERRGHRRRDRAALRRPSADARRRRAEHRPSRRAGHRMPCSSGFALRSMSSGTRSAGRAPS